MLALIFGMDIYLRGLQSSYTMKMDALENNKDSIEVVVLGNSHATYGVDPSAFDLFAVNLANANQSIYFDKRILLNHIDEMPSLKYVFISTDFHSLGFSDQGERNVWSYYVTNITHPNIQRPFLADLSPFLFGYGPNFSFKVLMKNFFREKIQDVFYFDLNASELGNPEFNKGYIPYKGQNTSEWNDESFEKRALAFQNESSKVENMLVENDLKDFVKLLKLKGIQPILFSSPTHQAYNSFFTTENINLYESRIAKIAETMDIPFWNYAFRNNYSQELFFNGDHLNAEGAYLFSQEINKRLMELEKL